MHPQLNRGLRTIMGTAVSAVARGRGHGHCAALDSRTLRNRIAHKTAEDEENRFKIKPHVLKSGRLLLVRHARILVETVFHRHELGLRKWWLVVVAL